MTAHSRDEEDKTVYRVVVNQEEQYSIWPEGRENPLGWRDVGKSGLKDECLAYIKEVWTDMRPLSLRLKMEELARNPPAAEPPAPEPAAGRESLVDRLGAGPHPLVVRMRPEPTAKRLKEAVDQGYVRVEFTDPGTELGVKLDRDASDFSAADFEGAKGTARIVGGLTLDYVKVRCVADIDLATLAGRGRLERAEAGAGRG
nr:mbtH-like protein [uncultured bacterium]